jgi:hypothetical protein
MAAAITSNGSNGKGGSRSSGSGDSSSGGGSASATGCGCSDSGISNSNCSGSSGVGSSSGGSSSRGGSSAITAQQQPDLCRLECCCVSLCWLLSLANALPVPCGMLLLLLLLLVLTSQGKICLIQCGQSAFAEKVTNCVKGGGIAAIIYAR